MFSWTWRDQVNPCVITYIAKECCRHVLSMFNGLVIAPCLLFLTITVNKDAVVSGSILSAQFSFKFFIMVQYCDKFWYLYHACN